MYTIKRDHRKRGFVLVTYSLMLTALVAMVGLAIDAGILYLVKSRLSASVDAAALAAGRSVNLASTVAVASANATTMANQFFTANFPTGYLGVTSVPTVTPTFTQELDSSGNPNGVLDIAVTASVSAPVYFMRIFGVNNVTVNSSGTATRRGLVMMLVLDISVSMNTPTTPTACQAMVAAARNFITRFSPYDRVGAVTFDYTAHNLYPVSQNFGDGSLDAALAGVTCNRNTNTTAGV
jgi:Flp pilus assembly protein TadG